MKKKDSEILQGFQEIENEKKVLPLNVRKKINKRIYENLLISVVIMIFYTLLILGTNNIDRIVYMKDLKIFSISFGVISVYIIEMAYRKENFKIGQWGIEIAIISIITLFCTYIYILKQDKYILYVALASYFIAIYYTIKNIKIYKKLKLEYIKSLNDIDEIVKKEKPEKKKETKRKK